MIHQPLSPDGVRLQISSSLRLLVLCHVCPYLFVIYYCLFIFSKNSFLSLAPSTNATPAFSTLWLSNSILLQTEPRKNFNIYFVESITPAIFFYLLIDICWLSWQAPGIEHKFSSKSKFVSYESPILDSLEPLRLTIHLFGYKKLSYDLHTCSCSYFVIISCIII